MVDDYYKQHSEEAEEMGLKINQKDGVIDEMIELRQIRPRQRGCRGQMMDVVD